MVFQVKLVGGVAVSVGSGVIGGGLVGGLGDAVVFSQGEGR